MVSFQDMGKINKRSYKFDTHMKKESERMDKLREKYKNHKFKPEEIASASSDSRRRATSKRVLGMPVKSGVWRI